MNVAGRLRIDLKCAAKGAGRATIASSRPLGITRAFTGQSSADAVRMIPLLFNVCGMAQGAAAAEAAERALGIETASRTRIARRLLVLTETAREHLIRSVGDWPKYLGEVKDDAAMLRIMRLSEYLRNAVDPSGNAFIIGTVVALDMPRIIKSIEGLGDAIDDLVLGEPIGQFERRCSAPDLEDWHRTAATPAQRLLDTVSDRGWTDAGRTETSYLPDLSQTDLATYLLGDDGSHFIASPTWLGVPRETSALGRQDDHPLVRDLTKVHGNGLLPRLAARLVELATLPGVMRRIAELDDPNLHAGPHITSCTPRSGCGLAHVEAARGRLIHGVEIENDIVRRYAILAPTEWNFHPAGIAGRGLAEIASYRQDVAEIADLFVNALDPCVGYDVRVH
jgi:coenzyme F420-reducing hydrogenase alpha subunit